jgi:hypothetical protein
VCTKHDINAPINYRALKTGTDQTSDLVAIVRIIICRAAATTKTRKTRGAIREYEVAARIFVTLGANKHTRTADECQE